MQGAARRAIKSQGQTFDLLNATRDGPRSTPDYSKDEEIPGTIEQRSMPLMRRGSSGEEVEADLEIRVVPGDDTVLRDAGDSEYWPSRLRSPSGMEYQVLSKHEEDGGVTVLSVARA